VITSRGASSPRTAEVGFLAQPPEDKQVRVRELVTQGRTGALVDDGINDAPALIEAQVGVHPEFRTVAAVARRPCHTIDSPVS